MKRIVSLLALALLAGLPGCGCKKKQEAQNKKVKVEQHVDMFSPVDMNDVFAADDIDEEPGDLRTFFDFDEEEEGFVSQDNDFYAENDNDDEQTLLFVDNESDDELRTLHFGFNKYGLTPEQKRLVDNNIEQVKQLVADAGTQVEPVVVVEGHACQEGDHLYNLALSEKRAKYVADLFVEAGVDQSIIKVVGRGQEEPVIIDGKVVDGTREERAANRRVVTRVIYS
jgi:outer membrane protein OmpA-like peptidoglycan-associated protein